MRYPRDSRKAGEGGRALSISREIDRSSVSLKFRGNATTLRGARGGRGVSEFNVIAVMSFRRECAFGQFLSLSPLSNIEDGNLRDLRESEDQEDSFAVMYESILDEKGGGRKEGEKEDRQGSKSIIPYYRSLLHGYYSPVPPPGVTRYLRASSRLEHVTRSAFRYTVILHDRSEIDVSLLLLQVASLVIAVNETARDRRSYQIQRPALVR